MGEWDNTTYIAQADARRVADAIVALLSREGMREISTPPARQPRPREPMQYADALANDVWGVAVFPGAPGWTVVKSAPFELFGERAPGAGHMRLVDLVVNLGADGFQVNLYDGSALILIEVDRHGRQRISGLHPYGGLRFRAEAPIPEERALVRFGLLPLQHLIDACSDAAIALPGPDGAPWPLLDDDAFVRRLAVELGGPNAAGCSNLTMVEGLIPHRPLHLAGGITLYFEWPARGRT